MKTKRVSFEVDAHHNVEDFRPYKISFVHRGSFKENVKHALFLAIKREGNWHGWFNPADEGGELGEGQFGVIKQIVGYTVDEAWRKAKLKAVGGTHEGVIYGYDFDGDAEAKPTKNSGLVLWACFRAPDQNFGFGYASAVGRPLNSSDTDKYANKWISLIK